MSAIRGRVRAPAVPGAPSPDELRGRWVLLDFWTAGCVNCVHVIDELRPLEHRWATDLVVIGIHSPKFDHEARPAAVCAAIERLGITHTVVNDPKLRFWSAYTVKAWPTLVLINPAGYIAATFAGEGHVAEIDAILSASLTPGSPAAGPGPVEGSGLRFPAGAVITPSGTVLVSDAGHHQVVELAHDLATELRRWGGSRGHPFVTPSGLTLVPADLTAELGYHVLLADAGGHQVHGLNLDDGSSRVVAGTGTQWWPGDRTDGPAATTALSTPTDVAWWPAVGSAVVAMAGNHTLALLDPVEATVRRLAGTGVEGMTDGPAAQAFLAQPSGVAVDGDTLWFVDAESSSLRRLENGEVHTAVGAGLFDFGHVDGPAADARLQHPMGLTVLGDHTVLIADTYNGAMRRYHPGTATVHTIATGIAEPYAVVAPGGRVVAVASSGHHVVGLGWTLADPVGSGHARVTVHLPPGTRLDQSDARVQITASPPGLLQAGAGVSSSLRRSVELADARGELTVTLAAVVCDTVPPHPVCRRISHTWVVPVAAGAAARDVDLVA